MIDTQWGHSWPTKGFFMSQNSFLPKLSADVLALVRNGVYSLYEIDGAVAEKFVLITNQRRMFLLSPDGEVVKQVDSIEGLRLKKTSVEKAQDQQFTVKLNYA